MENRIKITRYIYLTDAENWLIDGYDEYHITYLPISNKKNIIRIVVNGILTKEVLNILPNTPKKSAILSAISSYKNGKISYNSTINKKNLLTIKNFKDKFYRNCIRNYLLPINNENNRDVLTKYNLW